MADIAAVFHWSAADMEDMDARDLLRWHTEARKRAPYSSQGSRRAGKAR